MAFGFSPLSKAAHFAQSMANRAALPGQNPTCPHCRGSLWSSGSQTMRHEPVLGGL